MYIDLNFYQFPYTFILIISIEIIFFYLLFYIFFITK